MTSPTPSVALLEENMMLCEHGHNSISRLFSLFLIAFCDSYNSWVSCWEKKRRKTTVKTNTSREDKEKCSEHSAVCFLGERRRPLKLSSLQGKCWKKAGLLSVIKVGPEATAVNPFCFLASCRFTQNNIRIKWSYTKSHGDVKCYLTIHWRAYLSLHSACVV